MVVRLRGRVLEHADKAITIDVGSIGFMVGVAKPHEYKLHQEIDILVHLHWHQDQGPQLFGFGNGAEKSIFHLILSCSGLGPKIALSVLSTLTPGAFATAIVTGDVKALSNVDGIGIKKAESMIVHLRDKVAKLLDGGLLIKETKSLEMITKVNGVLDSLGYAKSEIVHIVDCLQREGTLEGASFDELIRKALSFSTKRP